MNSHYLYFWPVELPAVGHIALKVVGLEEGNEIYISHWPHKPTWFKKGQRNQQSLLDDIISEGNREPEILQIPFDFIDPAQIDRWLGIETKDPEKPYNLKSWNCANVVATALQIGLKARNLQLEVEKNFMEWRLSLVTPYKVFSWVQKKVKLDKLARENRHLPESTPRVLHPCAPAPPTRDFSGRSTHLLKICETLGCSSDKTLVVTAGTGGVGKTEFARKVAEEVFDFFEGRVFWMDSETAESLQNCLRDLVTHLKIPQDLKLETNFVMSKEQMKVLFGEIYSYFSSQGQNSLFIFDNANQFKPNSSSSSTSTANESIFLISDFLPNSYKDNKFSRCPAILITSRSSDWPVPESNLINLENFTVREAEEYFQKAFQTSEEQVADCRPEIELLHQRFDGYTLAFTLVAGWIRGAGSAKNLREGIKCYIQLFQRSSNNLDRKNKSATFSNTNYKWSPNEIMEQTCAAIGRENSLALKLLKKMSFLSPDFLTVNDCKDSNYADLTEINRALRTLKKFNVVSGDENGFGRIKIHRVIQLLVKENQMKSKDASILFDICDKMLGQSHSPTFTTVPHLNTLICNLEEFRSSLSFWFLLMKPTCFRYIKKLQGKITYLKPNDYNKLKKILRKLQNLNPPIYPKRVMDNSDIIVDNSDQFYKITYQGLAECMFQQVLKKGTWMVTELKVLKVLGCLGIWPQTNLDQAVCWLKSTGDLRLKHQFFSFCLENPNLNQNQRQELESLQIKFHFFGLDWHSKGDKMADNWLNILLHNETLDGRPVVLTDLEKVEYMKCGISSQYPDQYKHYKLLVAISEHCKKSEENTVATKLLGVFIDRSSYVLSVTGQFQEIFSKFLAHPRLFSQDHLDAVIKLIRESKAGGLRARFWCWFILMISILSVRESKFESETYSEKLHEVLNRKDFEEMEANFLPEDRTEWKVFRPYLNFFVEQHRDSEHEHLKRLVQVTQSVFPLRVN